MRTFQKVPGTNQGWGMKVQKMVTMETTSMVSWLPIPDRLSMGQLSLSVHWVSQLSLPVNQSTILDCQLSVSYP